MLSAYLAPAVFLTIFYLIGLLYVCIDAYDWAGYNQQKAKARYALKWLLVGPPIILAWPITVPAGAVYGLYRVFRNLIQWATAE